MDRKLLDLLRSPDTHQSLNLLESRSLDILNKAIATGQITNSGGQTLSQSIDKALITKDRKQIYPIKDGIPVLLPEEGIPISQLAQLTTA